MQRCVENRSRYVVVSVGPFRCQKEEFRRAIPLPSEAAFDFQQLLKDSSDTSFIEHIIH